MKTIYLSKVKFPFEEEFNITILASYYFDDFVKIANHPIWKKLTVRGVNLSGKTIKQAYKEMESIKFRGDIIDYLCYVSLNYALSHSVIIEKLSALETKDTLKILRSVLNYQTVYLVLSCRLILKDETYLDDVFKQFKLDKGEYYDGVKKFIYEKMNEFLKVEPGIDRIHLLNGPPASAFPKTKPKKIHKSNKLKRS